MKDSRVEAIYEMTCDWLQEFFADVQPWEEDEELGDEAEAEFKKRLKRLL